MLVSDLLKGLGIAYLKSYEDKLVNILLTGLSDEHLSKLSI